MERGGRKERGGRWVREVCGMRKKGEVEMMWRGSPELCRGGADDVEGFEMWRGGAGDVEVRCWRCGGEVLEMWRRGVGDV